MKMFFKKVKKEMKAVKWLSKEDTGKRLLIVLAGIAFVACLTALVDTGTQHLLALILR